MTRLLGLDPGTRRCGVAVSNRARSMAFPRAALEHDEHLVARIRQLVEDEELGGIVVGRPLALSGRVTESTQLADDLFHVIREAFPTLMVTQWDERLTTYEAQRALSEAGIKAKSQRDHLDSAAAVILLQNYLDGLVGD